MVPNLIGEAAIAKGGAGPWVSESEGITFICDWLTMQLMLFSTREGRRSELRASVATGLRHRLTGDAEHDAALIDVAAEGAALTTGKANVSRAAIILAKTVSSWLL